MASSNTGAKFISRNRAPRVQIEYEVEDYGSQKMVELPFVMAVMSDLAGKSQTKEAKIAPSDRKFQDIDIDNFDNKMAALEPRVAFVVKNELTGEGNIPVDISFKSMADFAPDKVAEKVDSLKKLLDARKQLQALLTYMDGKANAEALLQQIMKDPALLKTIAALPETSPPSGEK